jgi:hypothetical protein
LFTLRTEELQQQAGVFKRNANELKNKMWWKNMKVRAEVCPWYAWVTPVLRCPVALAV